MEASFYSGSSKRAKAPGNIGPVAHCLVDGCDADLSLCRDYHRRHKVCEIHSKTPIVTIGGREQRFCQQCSRFHSLVEFDEGKRSCRKRLDGHNRRRRKPQPDSLAFARNSPLQDFSTHQIPTATRFVSFTNPQMLPDDVVAGSSWPGIVKSDHDDISLYINNPHLNYIDRPNAFPEPSSHSQGVVSVTHTHLLQLAPQGNNIATVHQPLLEPNSVSGHSSGRALSLLSSAPTSTVVTREFHPKHMVQTDAPLPSPTHPSAAHNLHFGGGVGRYSPAHESKPFVPASGSDSTLHFPEMFQQQQLPHGDGSSSTSGTHQTLTFIWE